MALIQDYTSYSRSYLVLKRLHYLQTNSGFQTYLYTRQLHPIRYKFYRTQAELEEAIIRFRQQGFTVSNGTKVAEFFNRTVPRSLNFQPF